MTQAARVGIGLRQHQGKALHGWAKQRLELQPFLQTALRQARVGQDDGDGQGFTGADQVGPDLGFHQHTCHRLVRAQESTHSARGVIGQPDLGITFAQQRGTGFAPRSCAVCQQNSQVRLLAAQGLDERPCCARFAQ